MGVELKERVAYLQGLAAGLGIDAEAGPEGEVLTGILDVLQEMADSLDAARVAQSALSEEVDDLSIDMSELADEVMGNLGDAAVRWEVTCPGCGHAFTTSGADLEDDDVDLVCPNCGHLIHDFDSGLDSDESSGEEVSDRV